MQHKANTCLNDFNKRREIVTIFLLLLTFKMVFSQHSNFHLDSVMNFNEIPITSSSVSQFISTKADNDRFFMAFIKGNKFNLYDYDNIKKIIIKSEFKLKCNQPIGTKAQDFVVTDYFVYVMMGKKIYCLSKDKMKEIYSFHCGVGEYLFLSQHNLVVGFYYNYHPESSYFKAGLRKFDQRGKQIDSVFLDVPFPEYTHYLPRNLITYSREKFVFPLFNGLNFIFVSNDFKTIDTLKLTIEKFDSNWVFPSKTLSQNIADNRKDISFYWSLLDKENYKKISRIEYVQFIDSTNLLVRWYSHDFKLNLSNRYTFNLIKQSEFWLPLLKNTYIETPMPFNTSLKIFSGGMPLLSQSNLTTYTKHFIYQVKIDIPYIENIPYKEYYQKKMEKEKTLEPVISIWVFKYYD